jgi:uncharacterized membrane protein
LRSATSISIGAPPERVWAVMVDVERWPEWTPTMISVQRLDEGELRIGSRARVRQPKLPAAVWRVTSITPGRQFQWQAGNMLSKALAGHEIEPEGGAASRVTLWIDQAGLMLPLIALFYKGLTRRYIQSEIEGLKRRCEA